MALYSWADRRGVILDMAADVAACNEAHGWKDRERTFGDDVALLHSEVSEALDAWRDHGAADMTCDTRMPWHKLLHRVLGKKHLPKPEGVGSELADVLIRLLDTADRHGVDLYKEFERKMAYNWTRPYRHGGKKL